MRDGVILGDMSRDVKMTGGHAEGASVARAVAGDHHALSLDDFVDEAKRVGILQKGPYLAPI